ncbi:MAG TPA: phosphomannomutase/phosphoglucomutase [Myxococcales bacterium]|nr:phosphomannomutase/phosphoglucomutase [Myxococcales bacterium]
MTPSPQIFREYDIRGLVDEDLTAEVVELIGRGLGTLVRRANPGKKVAVAIGRDARESSVRFRDAMARGLNGAGCDAVDVGMIPTPLCYFAANTLPVDGLAMITGSHNPPEYNGLKVGVGKTTLHGGEIQELRQLIERGDFEKGEGGRRQQDIIGPYQDYVRKNLRLGKRRPKLVIDAGNGVGGLVAEPLFKSLGFPVTGLFLEPDGTFPNHHPDPTVLANVKDLQAKVLELHADLGLAYDGDADRLGVIDEKGNVLWGDQLMIILSREILKENPGSPIIGEVKCSMTLYDDIERHGGRPIMWKAGHSLIKAKMKETGAQLAGEMSGHLFFANRWFGFDDGVYASARLLEILSHGDAPLSSLLADVPKTFISPEIRFDCPEEKKFQVVAAVKQHFAGGQYKVVDVDGVRVTFPDGWGLVRASNTQALLVLRFEAKTEPRLREIQALIEGAVRDAMKRLSA